MLDIEFAVASQSYTDDASLSARKSYTALTLTGKCPFRTEENTEISFHPAVL